MAGKAEGLREDGTLAFCENKMNIAFPENYKFHSLYPLQCPELNILKTSNVHVLDNTTICYSTENKLLGRKIRT